MRIFHTAAFLFLIILANSCAIQVAPEGGLKDEVPPKLISSEPPNYSTNFSTKEIQLFFDEYVTLNDISSQLIVSPPLSSTPEIRVRKKSIVITINDTLLENTTYTMNFGQGIVDNNEGNKLDGFQFVFSTGSIIDSLSVSGKISNAFNLKTEKGIVVSLYKEGIDSLPYLKRPDYFARTNDSGSYMISNVAPHNYKIVALKETDANYLYLQGEEQIGFVDSLVPANSVNVDLQLFREEPARKLIKAYSEFPGKAVFVFNTTADSNWKWITDSASLKFHSVSFSEKNDSMTIWYKNLVSDSLRLLFDKNVSNDTMTIRLFKKQEDAPGKRKTTFTLFTSEKQTAVQHLHLPYFLKANRPIEKADFTKIVFMEDSVIISPKYFFTDSLNTQLSIEHNWKSKGNYSIFIPPGAFTDIFGIANDSINYAFSSRGETDYGSVKIKLKKEIQNSIVVQLTDEAGNVYRDMIVNQDTTFEFINLDPGTYKIKIIYDSNNNGKWDTGNYLKHIQPEKISFFTDAVTIRANWDVDVLVTVSED